jgi:hypothetical protein
MTTLTSLLTQISKEHLSIETLETRHSDSLDFHEVAVWGVENALTAAYEAGAMAALAGEACGVDLRALMESQRMVGVLWSIEDVEEVRSDLTGDQAWEVLQRCDKIHDCEVGFSWLLIETVADDLYPEPDDA